MTEVNRPDVLGFLKIRPVHTVVMTSFIQDNGLKNTDNRGKFYGYCNAQGTLEGVALIGHMTLIESRSNDSLRAFALLGLQLLDRVENICLLSNVEFKGAHRSFAKAGFKNTDCTQTIFV